MAVATKARKTAKKSVKRTTAKKVAAKKVAKKATSNGQRAMSASHKAALAVGRTQASAVRAYLDALEMHKPKRGRKVTPETMRSRITKLRDEAKRAPKSKQLQLVQDRMDLEAALAASEEVFDMAPLKKGFTKHAKAYARNKGISYAAFKEIGVPVPVLKEAGISRSS